MRYSEAIAEAPPGWTHFSLADYDRLQPDYHRRFENWIPGGELRRARQGDAAAGERLRKALFWTFVYEFEPERWDELSRAEPIHPGVLAALSVDGKRVLEIGAGSGRLTQHLAERAAEITAVEPSSGLCRLLASRVPRADIRVQFAEVMSIPDGWADLSVSCSAFGPEEEILRELERCTRKGGTIAFVSPRELEWFAERGWEVARFDPAEVQIPPHDPALERFFGPIKPPSDLAWRQV